MLVAKYKRTSEDDEEPHEIASSSTQTSATVGSTSEEAAQTDTNMSSPALPVKALSVAPVIPAYKLGDTPGGASVGFEVGPRHPNKPRKGELNTFAGRVEDDGTDAYMFELQRRSFETSGVSFDPSGRYVVQKNSEAIRKTERKRKREDGTEVVEEQPEQTPVDEIDWRRKKDAQLPEGVTRDPRKDPAKVTEFLGSWGDLGKRKRAPTREEEAEAKKKKDEEEAAAGDGSDGAPNRKKAKLDEESEWHGRPEERQREDDGTCWLTPPRGAVLAAESRIEHKDSQVDHEVLRLLMANNAEGDEEGKSAINFGSSTALKLTQKFSSGVQNFIPKKVIQNWTDSPKGLSACRFIPRYGHLILSASMDGCLRIYESGFYDHGRKRRRLMTYKGHEQAIREIDWSPDGTRFLSASFDRYVRLWDAETGKTISKYQDGKSSVPNCVRFYPLDGAQIFLVGQSNRKIVQWDSRSGEIVQEYNRHLGGVNSITFIDENRRFVTSSEDRSIRVWDFDVPVDIKYIADPKMHSMPCITLHPNGKNFLCQGLDNKIHVYSTRDKFPANHKKKFTGHLVSGYACHVAVSPDGRCVTSGDSSGQLFFWDWKTCKLLKKVKAHTNTSIDVQWHPLTTSTLVSAGWDGALKLWD